MQSIIPNNYKTALIAAIEASRGIMNNYSREINIISKSDGSPVTNADIAASEIINEFLKQTNIPITGEESVLEDYSMRMNWKQSWCVDPLDGTKEFIKKNGEFAVNIALIENSVPTFGLIASPVQEKVLFGSKSTGVYFIQFNQLEDESSWKKIDPIEILNNPLIVSCSRSHHSGNTLDYLKKINTGQNDLKFIKKGSSIKFFDLALGNADVYPRFAPTMEWDIAAGQAILEALGGEVVHAITGQPLEYNKANLYNPYFIAKTKAFKDQMNE